VELDEEVPMRRLYALLPHLVLVAGLAVPLSLTAQETSSDTLLTVGHFLDLETVGDPRLSPDASQVVYARNWVNKLEDKWESDLWIMNVNGSKNRFLVRGSSPRWSPDGTRIAYLADGEPEGAQIFVRWMDAEGSTTQITRVTETPGNIKWSPDGNSVSFTMIVPAGPQKDWQIDLPAAPEGAKWTKSPRIVERMHYRADRRGFLEQGYTHLFVVPAEGGTARQLTKGEWNVGARFYGIPFGVGYDWTPDSEAIVFDGFMEEDWDLRYRESHIYAVNIDSREIRQITSEKGPWSNPVVSPDGRRIAFTGYEWTEQTYKASNLYVIGEDGGMSKISGSLDRDPQSLHWAADSRGVYFTVGDRGTQNIYFASTSGGVRQVTEGAHMLSLNSMAENMAVGVRRSFHEPGDVVTVDLRRPQRISRLTAVNADLLADMRLGGVEEISYNSSDGTPIQGWLVKPPSFDPAEKYPLILHIHGGPHAMYNVGFSYSYQNFAANGYLVLYTNPRGSTGYGTDFGNAIDNAYPSVDYEDLMAGVDAVIERGYVDTESMFATGVSGGGVLSSWIVGHTDRFAAAAVRAPVINWISFAGNADITNWGYHRFYGYFWDNPDKWLEHSPLMHVENVTTPTLLMTGELDLRTPMGQTEEFYQALKALGVPTAMIRFHEEYHGTGSKPSNFMRTQLYLMKWFGKHSAGKQVASREEG
jgi:dipeptidyl aminopeptidase/acylaminoacyl peptidase